VKHIWKVALKKARVRGSKVHRQLLSQFPSFWDIRRAILNDGEVDSEDGYIICTETSVDTEAGPGRVDILLLRREVTLNGLRAVWRPVLLLDLKSRLGLQWSLVSSERMSDSRTRHGLQQRVVPGFDIKTRSLDAAEWESIIEAVPTTSMSEQVKLYADAVDKSYEEIIDEPCPSIPIGTFIVDTETDLRALRSVLRTYIIEVYESLPDGTSDYPRTAYHPIQRPDSPQAAIVIHQQDLPLTSNRVSLPPAWKPSFDPLQGAYSSKRRFILNISIASPTSSGKSAARVSRYWNGLQLISELADEKKQPDIIWFDLADEFTNPSLAAARLHLRPRSNSEDDRYYVQPRKVRELFDTISVQGLHQKIQTYLFKDGPPPQLDYRQQKLVIVSGWDWVHSGTPGLYRERLNQLLASILDNLPDDESLTVIWFDSPVPGQESSPVYSTRATLPFYPNSPLFQEVTEIIWDFPIAPRSEIMSSDWILPFDPIAPCYDEIRVMLHQTNQGYESVLTQVPKLIGWSNRFRAETFRYSRRESKFLEPSELVPDSDSRNKMKALSLDLIPWILDLHPSRYTRAEPKPSIEIDSVTLKGIPQSEPTLLERLRLFGDVVQGSRAYITVTSGRINSQRSYRSPSNLRTKQRSSFKVDLISEPQSSSHFGQVITLSSPEFQTEVLVSEDPSTPGRWLIGMFTESSLPNDDGFVWTKLDESRFRDVLNSSPADLQIRQQVFVKTEEQLLLWEKEPADSNWSFVGVVEFISGQGGRFSIISGIRVIPDDLDVEQPPAKFPDDFDTKSRRLLEKLSRQIEQTQSVSVKLEESDSHCGVVFIDSTDDIIQSVPLLGICDIIDLLRYPLTSKRPIRTPNSRLMTWNSFTDIEYGKFDYIRSLVETTTYKDVEKSITPIIVDEIEPAESILELILKHNPKTCPIITDEERQHGRCWRLLSPSEDAPIMKSISSAFSGREIYGILTTGRIRHDNDVYSIDLKLGAKRDEPEFYAYHEDKWIRRLLRENDIHFKRLAPGTFIQIPEQKWTLNIVLYDTTIEWTVASNITGFLLEGKTFTHMLNPTHNLQEAINSFYNNLTLHIEIDAITNLDEEISLLRTQFESRQYGPKPPPCRLESQRDTNTIRITLVQIGGRTSITLMTESIILSELSDKEDLLDSLNYRLEEGDLSGFNIVNELDFIENLKTLMSKD
jgi:hypothetical protein